MGTPVKPKYINVEGRIHSLYQTRAEGFETAPVNKLALTLEGIVGESRSKRRGLTMPADVRTRGVPKGREMRHRQHVSILGLTEVEELIGILDVEHRIGEHVEPTSLPGLVAQSFGANILWASVGPVSDIPNGSRITVLDEKGMAEDWAPILETSRYNSPCIDPCKALAEAIYADLSPARKQIMVSKLAKDVLKHMALRRGVVASVESASNPSIADELYQERDGLQVGNLQLGDVLSAYTLQQTSDDK